MTRLMTWFIELQNRFNESRLSKTSTIYVLNRVDDLTSWHVVCWTRQWCSIESDTCFLVYEQKSRLSMTKNSDLVWSKHWAFCNWCRNADYRLSFLWTRWARRMMRSWRKWTLCLDDRSNTSLSSEACDWTSDIVCFERVFLHRSTQFCDYRNDAMIADRS